MAKKIEFEIGSNINNWTIIRKEPNTNDGKSRYLCKCICGNLSVVLSTYLYTGRSTKCKNCKQIKTSNQHRFDPSLLPKISERYINGESSEKLAAEYNLSASTIVYHLRKNGVVIRSLVDIGEKRRRCDGTAAKNKVYKGCKSDAKRRKLTFSITKEQFFELVTSACHYCGTKSSKIIKTESGSNFICNGLDRIDPNRGYELNNIVPCCFECNRAKSNMSLIEFKNWLSRVFYHFIYKENKSLNVGESDS